MKYTTKVYSPTNLEVASLFSRVLCDRIPSQKVNALFIHGELADPRIEKPLLLRAHEVWRDGLCEFIVINGLTAKECKKRNHGYDGYEKYLAKLKKLGIPEDVIFIAQPSENTGLESQNFLLMAHDRNWHNLMIEAAPYHQVRCFLQAVAAMEKFKFNFRIYNTTYNNVDWDIKVKRKIMLGSNVLGQKDETGPLVKLLGGEMERIEKYTTPSSAFIASATFEQALDYLRKRDA